MNADQIKRIGQVSDIYTPSYPIELKDLFSGRNEQLVRAVSIVPQKGLHAIIFGDRGVGKTSFANMLKILMESSERQVQRVSCNSEDTFTTLWKNILSRFTVKYQEVKERVSFVKDTEVTETEYPLSTFISTPEVSPEQILELLKFLNSPIIIIDEFDRLEDAFFNKKVFTDVIKAISDTSPNVTLVIVGVSEDIATLIQEHASIERNLSQIYMPVMSTQEIEELVLRGEEPLGIKFASSVVEKIIGLSSGYPHFAHSLCYHSVQNAILTDTTTVDEPHLQVAIKQTIDAAHESLRNTYRIATIATKQNIYADVIFAASVAPTDEYGYFQANDLEEILTKELGKEIKVANFVSHLGKFCTPERGEILKSTGIKNRQRYKFKNPLMRAFIRLKKEYELQNNNSKPIQPGLL